MARLLLLSSPLVLCLAGCQMSQNGLDKGLHMLAGAVVADHVTRQTGDPWKGCAAAIGIGVLKEVIDSRTAHGVVDGYDVLATGAGCTFSWTF